MIVSEIVHFSTAPTYFSLNSYIDRPLKIYYCPPRPGDVWPPENDGRGGSSKPASRVQEKPEGCRKLFVGNLSYEIDDDTIVEFFKPAGVLTGLRWLTHKDSGDFRVCYCVFHVSIGSMGPFSCVLSHHFILRGVDLLSSEPLRRRMRL